jgi:hypothetical protein
MITLSSSNLEQRYDYLGWGLSSSVTVCIIGQLNRLMGLGAHGWRVVGPLSPSSHCGTVWPCDYVRHRVHSSAGMCQPKIKGLPHSVGRRVVIQDAVVSAKLGFGHRWAQLTVTEVCGRSLSPSWQAG